MIKYGATDYADVKFCRFYPHVEIRDEQWIDIVLKFDLEEGTTIPEDWPDPSILVVCNHRGGIAHIVPQEEGCDSEYQFSEMEKEQIRRYVIDHEIYKRVKKTPESLY